LQGLTAADVEIAFREHAAQLNVDAAGPGGRVIAFDGSVLQTHTERKFAMNN
jgi:hypothetical protein